MTTTEIDSTLEPRDDGVFRWVFAAALFVTVAPLWLVEHLPCVDLPQHAAQVATWRRWVDGTFAFGHLWEVNYRTPYLLSRALAFALSYAMPILDAYRLILSVAIVGIPLATLLLLREVGGSRWWALATLPVGLGFSFDWGFVAYSLAVPLGLLHVWTAWRYAREPTARRALWLWLFTQGLFFAHVIVFGWAGLVAASLIAARSDRVATFLRRATPLLAALPVALLWLATTHGAEAGVRTPASWAFTTDRYFQVFSLIVGAERFDVVALVLGFLLVATPLVVNGKPSLDASRWLPFVVSLGLFMLAPFQIFGTAFLYTRFSVFLLPTWLLVLEPRRRPIGHPATIAVPALVVLAGVAVSLVQFDREVGRFDELVERIEPGRRTLYMAYHPKSEHVRHPAYLHFGQWVQVERGGIVDFSFGDYFPNLFRYRREVPRLLPSGFEHRPWLFEYREHGGEVYDYFLIRTRDVDPMPVFGDGSPPLERVDSAEGGWFLYRVRPEESPVGRRQ